MKHSLFVFAMGASLFWTTLSPRAEIRPDRVHAAVNKQLRAYIHDGLITGGDRMIDQVIVKDIRRSTNSKYDRIVMDLIGTQKGEPAAIKRPPYYQIAVTPDERRIIFTLWGNPKLDFDPKKILASFKHSSVIQNIVLLPRLEDQLWTFVIELKSDSPVEVFELSNPVRVIVDIKHKQG